MMMVMMVMMMMVMVVPLPDIVRIAGKHKAMVMVDEAHGTGIFGENGRGVVEHFNLNKEVYIVMGTLSKAIGSLGGYVCGDIDLINYLRNKARSFMYTTALPPAVCAASIAGIKLIQNDPSLRELLWHNVRFYKREIEIIELKYNIVRKPDYSNLDRRFTKGS